ncbi:MAG TPA: hypothetical protein VGL97_00520, partial [Bryobacteraceae bacterium]
PPHLHSYPRKIEDRPAAGREAAINFKELGGNQIVVKTLLYGSYFYGVYYGGGCRHGSCIACPGAA